MNALTSSSLELSLKLRSTIADFGEEWLKDAAELTAKELKEKIAEDLEAHHRELLKAKDSFWKSWLLLLAANASKSPSPKKIAELEVQTDELRSRQKAAMDVYLDALAREHIVRLLPDLEDGELSEADFGWGWIHRELRGVHNWSPLLKGKGS